MVVGDDICGYNYIRIVPATLAIVPAYTDVNATIAWKDSSNKDGLRPSALAALALGASALGIAVVAKRRSTRYARRFLTFMVTREARRLVPTGFSLAAVVAAGCCLSQALSRVAQHRVNGFAHQ